jgi:hypothetical protein
MLGLDVGRGRELLTVPVRKHHPSRTCESTGLIGRTILISDLTKAS